MKVSYLLSKSGELENISQLIGLENLPADQQLVILIADLIKNGFLIQNAFDDVDRYCSPQKTLRMIKILLKFYHESLNLIQKQIPIFRIKEMSCINLIKRMRLDVKNEELSEFDNIVQEMVRNVTTIQKQYSELF